MSVQNSLETRPSRVGLSDRRVLVADDQPSIIDAMLLLLKAAGISADRASTPDEVAALVAAQKYDLLLMDMNYARDTTSGAEGLELLARIKMADPALSVVVMTAWSTVDIAVASLQRGASDFIQKPWDNTAALSIIEKQIVATRERRRDMAIRKAELEEATLVHRTLMGATLGRFGRFTIAAGTRTHREVGGDYFDAFEVDQDRLALCVADVMGKGVGAAMVMANVQAHFRTVAQIERDPAAICRSLNTNLRKTLGGERLVTMFNASLRLDAGEFAFCSAGHPPAILVRAAGHIEPLSSDDAVLGSFPKWDYRSRSRVLNSGDRIAMVSDGFLECTDAQEVELGDERFAEWAKETRALSASAMHEQLTERLMGFCGGQLNDDVTLMVVAAD
jgi:sigma-B regulation protein RsbU (phosphoserine phosphatase)